MGWFLPVSRLVYQYVRFTLTDEPDPSGKLIDVEAAPPYLSIETDPVTFLPAKYPSCLGGYFGFASAVDVKSIIVAIKIVVAFPSLDLFFICTLLYFSPY